MINVAGDWNTKQKDVKVLLLDQETFPQGKDLLLEMHRLLHDSKVYKTDAVTYYDDLWDGLTDETCRIISSKETSILWNIWHITRIEDIISNIAMANRDTIFTKEVQAKLNIQIKDTGNAMRYSEIEFFNRNINIKALKEYRVNVGKSTKRTIESLEYRNMKRKVTAQHLERITQNGALVDDPKSMWLLDFWGRKNTLGLLMMPITRHQIVHLNDCFRIKERF